MSGEIYISQTRLGMLSRCGEQFRRRYIEGERMAPAVAMLVGRAVDQSVNANLESKIETGALLPSEAVQDLARDSLTTEWRSEEVELSEEEAEKGTKAVRGEAIDKSIRLAVLHHAAIAPDLEPTSVQRKFRARIKGESNIILTGVLDVEEKSVVRDTKTSGKSPQKNAADLSLQLTMYALAVLVETGEAPETVALDYLVDLKTPKAVTQTSTRGQEDFRVLLSRIEAFARVVQAGAFAPASPDDWICSPKWCGYHSTCPYARRPVVVPVSQPLDRKPGVAA